MPDSEEIAAAGTTIAGAAARPDQTVGYRSGALSIETLLAAVPDLADFAHPMAEQPLSKGSEDMTSADWLLLARRIRDAGRTASADAIVVTHGTDTLEETSWFLDLVCPVCPPVVLTGAMRPATATGADGPANLRLACLAAAEAAADALAANAADALKVPPVTMAPTGIGGTDAPRIGLRVAFHGCLYPAHAVAKVHTMAIDAFADRDPSGPGLSGHFADVALPDALPRVALLTAHVDCDPAIIDWHLARGARGIVIAGTGNGTLARPMRAALARAAADGTVIVRASRVPAGPVIRNAESDPADQDDALGFLVAGRLGPLKARILLQCALMAGLSGRTLADLFLRFDVRP